MLKRKHFIILGSGALALALLMYLKVTHAANDRPHYGHERMTITRSDGVQIPYKLEVAQNPDEQAYGLMFLQSMPARSGMIFPYNPAHEVAFWMKNTYIPLDMLFVRPDHTIGKITANARPFDVTPLASGVNVAAVVEINGGEALKEGIQVGDRVDSPSVP